MSDRFATPEGSGPYRVFVGQWNDDADPDWSLWDHRFETWDAARGFMVERLGIYDDGSCPPCRDLAAEALVELAALESGSAFEACVDGEDYMIQVPVE